MKKLLSITIPIILVLAFVSPWIFMKLWNNIIPMFNGPEFTYWQSFMALALLYIIGQTFTSGIKIKS